MTSRRESTPYHTKSRYIAGLQCPKRLWLSWHEPAPYEEPEPGSPLDIGIRVGRKAHLLFPGGVEVTDKPWEHAAAVARTRELMDRSDAPAIFEAAFKHENVRIRVDVLERMADGAWGLREVKASTKLKQEHHDDIAVQLYVLLGCGLKTGSVELVHVDNSYVHGEGDIDWHRYFARADVADEVRTRLPDVAARVRQHHGILVEPAAPAVEPSGHCWTPHECEFWDRCTASKPDDWVFYLPKRPNRFEALRAAGIESIREIPDDFPLTAEQALIRDVLISGEGHVSDRLGDAIKGFGPPAFYLDFETMNPAIPLYPGTRPYQQIPFEWSVHHLDESGSLAHHEFLADGTSDPRRALAEGMIEALGKTDLPILVYTGFERRVINGLIESLPGLKEGLQALQDRLCDLHAVVRSHLYHPDFGGSFSIKSVAPALIPGFGYNDLQHVAEGSAASATFERIAAGRLGPDEDEAALRTALLAYCKRDTLAMVELHRVLLERARR